MLGRYVIWPRIYHAQLVSLSVDASVWTFQDGVTTLSNIICDWKEACAVCSPVFQVTPRVLRYRLVHRTMGTLRHVQTPTQLCFRTLPRHPRSFRHHSEIPDTPRYPDNNTETWHLRYLVTLPLYTYSIHWSFDHQSPPTTPNLPHCPPPQVDPPPVCSPLCVCLLACMMTRSEAARMPSASRVTLPCPNLSIRPTPGRGNVVK